MRKPPPLTLLPRYPITGGVALLAVTVTFLWWSGTDVSWLFMNYQACDEQPWRLVGSALPHVNPIHLLFNLYWLWVFGTLVEDAYGPGRTAAIYLLLAAGSSAAEYAVSTGGVGLSGVGYGLFGLLWVLSRRDERFTGAVDPQTVALFLVWFVLCCVLTAADIWRIGNVAHAAGAVLGLLLGLTLVAHGQWRLGLGGVLGVAVVVLFLAASVGRRYVNFSAHVGEELAYDAYQAQKAGDHEKATKLYRRALELEGRKASWWYNLGISYQTLGDHAAARDAYKRAVELDPDNARYRAARDALRPPAE